MQNRAQGSAVGGVRILAGLMWLANLHWKVPTDFGQNNGGGLYKYVAAGAQNAPLAPYRWVLRELVLPNFQVFGWFTLISETIVAGLLLVGYRSRSVALAGAAMAVPIGLSVLYYPNADEWAWSYLLMIGLHLLLWAVPSGEHLGVDGVLAGPPERGEPRLALNGHRRRRGWCAGSDRRSLRRLQRQGSRAAGKRRGLHQCGWRGHTAMGAEAPLLQPACGPCSRLPSACRSIVGSRKVVLAYAAAGGLAVLALVVFIQRTFDYLRDDGAVQRIATGTNVVFWGGLALASALLARRASAAVVPLAE